MSPETDQTSASPGATHIATDIGGTFTDLVFLEEGTGRVGLAKAPTTPPAFEDGISDALDKTNIAPASVTAFIHGTTVVINALTERKGATTALITTRGFRDVLELARSNRPALFNLRYEKPKPFVERYLRFEVTERMLHDGSVLTPLAEDEVSEVARRAVERGAQAIAVCFLHAYANREHELRARELIEAACPGIAVTVSHEIAGEWREYERTNTAVLNAYVQEVAESYLEGLRAMLSRRKIGGRFYVMQSSGGTMTVDQAKRQPIALIESGPVGGVAGAAVIGELIGQPNLLTLDIGGTTAKTSLIERGEPKVTNDYKIEWRQDWAGYPVKVPVVDIVEIGAGGGSIAGLDAVGGLRVGPESAGAVPGPACYPNGGSRPTITDANLIVGRINPEYFLGGEMEVSVDQARAAMRQLAEPLGMEVEEAALGVIRLANASMVNALKLVSVRRGRDPRNFDMMAFGGGGSMHAAALAAELRIPRLLIPQAPGHFSAWGMLMTDLRADWVRTFVTPLEGLDANGSEVWEDLERQAADHFATEGVESERLVTTRLADMRYRGQEHSVTVSVAESDPERVAAGFHEAHERLYAFRLDVPVEIVNFRLTAIGTVEKPELKGIDAGPGDAGPAFQGHRTVLFDVHGEVEAGIFQREKLGAGDRLAGPAVVEDSAASTVVHPGQGLEVDQWGNLVISTEELT
jgi:N-methylhydantoinase A